MENNTETVKMDEEYEIESVHDLVVYDVTNMTQEEFDAFLAPYLK